jgi:hypothetical protein
MIPLLERYLNNEPTSLLARYPSRARVKRATTVMFFNEDLQILKVQTGERRVSSAAVETATLSEQVGACKPQLTLHPEIKPDEYLVQAGESYRGPPVVRADIQENGSVANLELIGGSGIHRLDTLLMADANQWKYGTRPNCGVVQANIVVTVDWKQ